MSNEIVSRTHAMALFTGPLAAAAPSPAYPNGVVMNAEGVRALVRIAVGQYYLVLINPIEFDAIPPGDETNRPPFTRALPFGADLASAAPGVNNKVDVTIVPTDIPRPAAPAAYDVRGSLFVQVRDAAGADTDNFLAGVWALGFPNTGASGDAGQWPAINGEAV